MDLLRLLGRFRRQHRRIETAVIQHRANLVACTSSLTRIDNIFLNVVEDWEVAAHTVERQRLIAIGRITCGQHVVFRPRPPDANEVFHREADVGGLLNRNLVHHTPAPHQDKVRTFAADLQPLGLLLLTWVIDRQQLQLKTMLFSQAFQRADRLLTVGGVVVNQRDLLARDIAAVRLKQVVHRA